VVVDELAEVFVGGDEPGLVAVLLGAEGECAHDVVGFPAGSGQLGQADGGEDFVEVVEREGEFFGHLLALGFVLGEDGVARGGFGGVPGNGDVCGVVGVDEVEDGGQQAVDGRGVDAAGGADGFFAQGKVGTVSDGHAVNEPEGFFFHLCK